MMMTVDWKKEHDAHYVVGMKGHDYGDGDYGERMRMEIVIRRNVEIN